MKIEQQDKVIAAVRKAKNIGEIVGNYVALRDEKEAEKKKFAERVAPIDAVLGAMENRFMELLQDSGQDSAKTPYGTVFQKVGSSTKVADWNVLIDYIKKNDAFDLLVKNVSKEAVKVRMDESGEIVPGVDLVTFKSVQVRRA